MAWLVGGAAPQGKSCDVRAMARHRVSAATKKEVLRTNERVLLSNGIGAFPCQTRTARRRIAREIDRREEEVEEEEVEETKNSRDAAGSRKQDAGRRRREKGGVGLEGLTGDDTSEIGKVWSVTAEPGGKKEKINTTMADNNRGLECALQRKCSTAFAATRLQPRWG